MCDMTWIQPSHCGSPLPGLGSSFLLVFGIVPDLNCSHTLGQTPFVGRERCNAKAQLRLETLFPVESTQYLLFWHTMIAWTAYSRKLYRLLLLP